MTEFNLSDKENKVLCYSRENVREAVRLLKEKINYAEKEEGLLTEADKEIIFYYIEEIFGDKLI